MRQTHHDMDDTQRIARDLEALLYAEGEPLSMKKISAALQCDSVALMKALDALSAALAQRGITLVRTDTDVALAVAPGAEEVISRMRTESLSGDIGDAGLEVLAIILYRGDSTRADIDYIRGVNSSFSIRSLLSRGLLERVKNPTDSREFLYRPTIELLAHLGVRDSRELPERDTIRSELAAFEATRPQGEDGPFGHNAGTTDTSLPASS